MPVSAAAHDRIEAERLRSAEIRRQQERDVEAHVQAVKTARSEVETKLRDLQGHLDALQRASRRAMVEDPGSHRYRVYYTAQTRLVGAMGHALKRSQGNDRLLELGREEQLAAERRQQESQVQERVQAAVQDVFNLQLPKEDDFESLYGGEVSNDGP